MKRLLIAGWGHDTGSASPAKTDEQTGRRGTIRRGGEFSSLRGEEASAPVIGRNQSRPSSVSRKKKSSTNEHL